jgi:hypothetical protein
MEGTLSQLMAATGAETAGLFLARGGPVLLWGAGMDQVCLDRVREAWRDQEARLRDARPVWKSAWCVWPTEADRGLVLLYLGGASLSLACVRASVEGLTGLLQMLVGLSGGTAPAGQDVQRAVDLYLGETPTEAIERRQLTVLLHEAEWNVSRVARMLGVTRVTIYKRMKRLGIERLKVRKTDRIAESEG